MLQRSLQCVCPRARVPITSILRSQPLRRWQLSKGAGQLREIGPGNQSRWACEEMQNLVSFGLCCQQKSGLKHSVNISNRLCWDPQLAGIPALCVAADAAMMVWVQTLTASLLSHTAEQGESHSLLLMIFVGGDGGLGGSRL